MTARDHNKLLAIFFFIQGGLSAFGGIVALLIYGGMGAFMLTSGPDAEAKTVGGVFMVVGVVVGIFILAIAGFILLTAWKVLKEQPSGRIMAIIASIFSLMSFPLGTALGVYGLWFLFGEQGTSFYDRSGGSMTTPPPPNSWQ